MGMQPQQTKATPTLPSVAGKNAPQGASGQGMGGPQMRQTQPVFGGPQSPLSGGQNSMMGLLGQGQGPQGFGQGYMGQFGQNRNPNMGGLPGFQNSAINTLSGGNVAGSDPMQGVAGYSATPQAPRRVE